MLSEKGIPSFNRPPDCTWRRPPGRPRNKWLDQLSLQLSSEQSVGDVEITKLDWKRVPRARSRGCKSSVAVTAECSRHHAGRNVSRPQRAPSAVGHETACAPVYKRRSLRTITELCLLFQVAAIMSAVICDLSTFCAAAAAADVDDADHSTTGVSQRPCYHADDWTRHHSV